LRAAARPDANGCKIARWKAPAKAAFIEGAFMSAAKPSAATSTSTDSSDNQFKLSDHENKTNVTLSLIKGGPVTLDSSPGPTLQYRGIEGTLSFSGKQVVTETTALGQMFTVTLNIVPDLRTLKFSLILPSVTNKAGDRTQDFHTIAIKAQVHTTLTGTLPPGANTSYEVIKMHGTAEKLPVAL
jgi:hypothetical protein